MRVRQADRQFSISMKEGEEEFLKHARQMYGLWRCGRRDGV